MPTSPSASKTRKRTINPGAKAGSGSNGTGGNGSHANGTHARTSNLTAQVRRASSSWRPSDWSADRFSEEANRAGCKIAIDGADGVHGRWDRLRLEQVMTNLLSNAIKYAAGAPVEIDVENGGPTVRLTVQDHGIGIAAEDLTRIFGRFERAAPSRHYGGFGVGLYITQQIVAAHGGTIGVTSEVGRGSRFVVELRADHAAP